MHTELFFAKQSQSTAPIATIMSFLKNRESLLISLISRMVFVTRNIIIMSVASGICEGSPQVDQTHTRIVSLSSLFAKILTDKTHTMHSLLPGSHVCKIRTHRATGLNDETHTMHSLLPGSHVCKIRTHRAAGLMTMLCNWLLNRIINQLDGLVRCVKLWNILPGYIFSDSVLAFERKI